jgi:hypothetical protein
MSINDTLKLLLPPIAVLAACAMMVTKAMADGYGSSGEFYKALWWYDPTDVDGAGQGGLSVKIKKKNIPSYTGTDGENEVEFRYEFTTGGGSTDLNNFAFGYEDGDFLADISAGKYTKDGSFDGVVNNAVAGITDDGGDSGRGDWTWWQLFDGSETLSLAIQDDSELAGSTWTVTPTLLQTDGVSSEIGFESEWGVSFTVFNLGDIDGSDQYSKDDDVDVRVYFGEDFSDSETNQNKDDEDFKGESDFDNSGSQAFDGLDYGWDDAVLDANGFQGDTDLLDDDDMKEYEGNGQDGDGIGFAFSLRDEKGDNNPVFFRNVHFRGMINARTEDIQVRSLSPATPVPTMGAWGIILLSAVLTALASVRRRKTPLL